ncbi:OmpL47-type beta-barrel domain-containing protein [Sinomonas sp. RB5]
MTAIQTRPARRSVLTPTARLRHVLRRGWAALAALLLAATGGATAFAYWQATSTAPDGLAVADTLLQGSTPSAQAAQANVTVAWTSSTTAGGRAASGYSVRRYSAATGGTPVAATGGCAGILVAASCTEGSVPDGTWYYTVTPVLGNWAGPESSRSAAALADATAPTVSAAVSPTPNAAGYNSISPVAVTLTAQDNPGGSGVASVSYSLDGAQQVTAPGANAAVSVAGDGTHQLAYSATDASGNRAPSQSLTVKIDTQAPGTPSLVVPSYVNLANASKVTVSGTAEPASTVTVTASDGAGHSAHQTAPAQSNGSWTIGNLDLSGFTDGTVTFSAAAQDAAGNVGPAASATAIKDTVAPAGTTIAPLVVSSAATASSTPAASATVSGAAEAGATVSLSISGAGGSPVSGNAKADSSGAWSVVGLNLTSFADGQLTYAAYATDAAGNAGQAVTQTGTKKTTTATPTFTNPPATIMGNKVSSVPLAGTAEAGASVAVTARDAAGQSASATASGSATWSATLDLSLLNSGPITFTAKATDAYGNTASASVGSRIGPKVKSVAVNNGGTAGTADAGDNIVITFSEAMKPSSICSAWTATAGPWATSGTTSDFTVQITSAGALTVASTTACPGVGFGTVSLGANYSNNSQTLVFKQTTSANGSKSTAASRASLSADGTVLTITLGDLSTGTAAKSVTAGTATYQPGPATDTASVGLPSDPATASGSGF